MHKIRRLQPLLPMILLIVIITWFDWPGIRPGRLFLAVDIANNMLPWKHGPVSSVQNVLISDPVYQFYPIIKQAVASIKQGEWLFWTPTMYLGHPALADPLFQSFYPIFPWLGLVFGVERGFTWGIYAHILLAALGMYGLLRTLGQTYTAALTGAMVFALSGYLITWLEFTFWISTLAWLPSILWTFHLALLNRRWVYVGASGLFLGLAILAGQIQFALAFLIFLGFYTLGWYIQVAFATKRQTGDFALRLARWPAFCWLATGLLGGLIAGVQILPLRELLELSRRRLDYGLTGPLPFSQLATLLLPDFYGNPAKGEYWGAGNYNEFTFYVGITALLVALAGVLTKPRFWSLYIWLITLGVVYFVIGGPGVAQLGWLPIIKYLSLHRMIFLLAMLFGLLIAKGMDVEPMTWQAVLLATVLVGGLIWWPFYENWGNAHAHMATLQGNLQVACGLLGITACCLLLKAWAPHWHTWVNFAIMGIVLVDLVLFGRAYNPTGSIRQLAPMLPAIAYLQEHTGDGRVVALQRNQQQLLVSNTLAGLGIAEPGGYSSLMSPQLYELVTTDDPNIDWHWFNRDHNLLLFSYPSSRLLDLLNVRYLVSPEVIFDPGPVAEVVNTDCSRLSPEITSKTPGQGRFVVKSSAINRLDLAFQLRPAQSKLAQLRLQMWRGDEQPILMLDQRISITDIVAAPTQTIYFSPERAAPGQSYYWKITPETISPTQATHTGVFFCTDQQGRPSISVYGTELAEVYRDDRVFIYERFAPFARASVVYAVTYEPHENLIVQRLLDQKFDLRNNAVSSVALGLAKTSTLPATPATVIEYKNTQVTLEAVAKTTGLLVLSDAYYPGWQASVDGKAAPIYRVNYVMRGVILPSGKHRVVFTFKPPSLRWGLAATCLGLICSLGLILSAKFQQRT